MLLDRQSKRARDRLFVHLGCAHLNHVDGAVFAAGQYVELGACAFYIRGVDDGRAIFLTNAYRCHRSLPRDVGGSERQTCGVDRDLVGIFVVECEHSDDDLHFVADMLGEERSDGAVDDAAGEYRVVRRPALAAQVAAAQYRARRVEALFVIDSEGEVVNVVACARGHHCCCEHSGIAVAQNDRAVGLLGEVGKLCRHCFAPYFYGIAFALHRHTIPHKRPYLQAFPALPSGRSAIQATPLDKSQAWVYTGS